MTRHRTALTVTALGLTGLLGLTACTAPDAAAPDAAPAAAAADLSGEAVALNAVGLTTGLEQAPAPSAAASAAPGRKGGEGRAVRKYLHKNTLHGEMTVQGKAGPRTVVVQRGAVTAVTATELSVKSTDGFTLTWALGDRVRVVKDKKKVDAAAVTVGAQIGVAGQKEGSATSARLIAVQ